ncbi:chromosome segregation protein SMC [Methyloversatilis sp. XJ19-49]|uniref:chromosome segregation protein SMC n=1 Tax=Methyloversatilis sp. XJ19-49 TaxID=2963429 RepID=UPI00211BC968|nr:chromosome segregation protein SMC [Methyloversatilis sp. XJ19-49]
MRLSKLKLAGFKTFVDPTTILMPGQLVGVVGPNGCGKSNIIDAVRWVLGESRASALRGDAMTDVIFNGSGTRKPVGRASVELVFDNDQGRAAGQWSQYAEIAVKRVLERDGQSDYFINNTRVRRRDVIDVFLGTGLGPRAYAIIEQGMITRIIEARPEELRAFLEEAAGITKYRERRRETQGRLDDARDNLVRLDDIVGELGSRIERLQKQAEVAARHTELNTRLVERQALLWAMKQRAAAAEADTLAGDAGRIENDIERETAALRHHEAALERIRTEHFASSEAVHAAQAELLTANAEASRLEDDLRRAAENRQKLAARIAQLDGEVANWRARIESIESDTARWTTLAEHAAHRIEQAEARHDTTRALLPEAEAAFQEAEQLATEARRELAAVEQQLKVEETHRANAGRMLHSLAGRRERIAHDAAQLIEPDRAALSLAQARLEELQAAVEAAQQRMQAAQIAVPQLQGAVRNAQDGERATTRTLTETRARRDALVELQRKTQSDGKLAPWLAALGLQDARPLWQAIKVEAGWELAVEAVLRERLGALDAISPDTLAAAGAAGAAPQTLTLALPGADARTPLSADSLRHRVQSLDARWDALLDLWLGPVAAVEVLALPAQGSSTQDGAAQGGAAQVDRQGRVAQGASLTLYAPDARTHGVLERARDIEQLGRDIDMAEAALAEAREALREAEAALAAAHEEQAAARREQQSLTQAAHTAQVEQIKLGQAVSRFDEQRAALERDRAEVDQAEQTEQAHLARAEIEIERARELIDVQRNRLDAALDAHKSADGTLREARFADQAAAREVQEAGFSQRECASRLTDLANNLSVARTQLENAELECALRRDEFAQIDERSIDATLQQTLDARRAREQVLATCRDTQEGLAAQLRDLDAQRAQSEQRLAPARERLAECRLKQQAAALNAEQFAQRLAEITLPEGRLDALVAEGEQENVREGSLNGEIARLNRDIAALGAVNLAALEELTQAAERKGYLDMQSADLREAIGTLEDAIRSMDRETRALLKDTYDRVNTEFGRIFPELFGGGEARLVMTGDEILDAGLQVFAQPPGKRNASIQLLSGGEKALTATALVFALFQLNPAPFCMLDEVDAPLDDTNTERFCEMVKRMSAATQFVFISHNKITMEMAQQLVGVTMQERGCSRVVEVDMEQALKLRDEALSV